MVGVVGSNPISPTKFKKVRNLWFSGLYCFCFPDLKGISVPVIRLPDGSERVFDTPVTVAQVATSIGAGLARAALAGKVNGVLVDTSHLIGEDCDLAIVTDKDVDGLEIIRHSTCLS